MMQLTATAGDSLLGVRSLALVRDLPGGGVADLARRDQTCSPLLCPRAATSTFSIDPASLPEGRLTLRAVATNVLGLTTSSAAWSVTVDRGSPAAPAPTARVEPDVGGAELLFGEGSDPALADGSPGSGVAGYEYRYQDADGAWSEWETASAGERALLDAEPGATVPVESRAVDGSRNESAIAARTVTVPTERDDIAPPLRCLPPQDSAFSFPYTGPFDNWDTGSTNLPNCRNLTVALTDGGSAQVSDATPVQWDDRPRRQQYRLRAPRGYGDAFQAGTILRDTGWVKVVDSYGNKVAYIKQPPSKPGKPFLPNGVFTVNSKRPEEPAPGLPGSGTSQAGGLKSTIQLYGLGCRLTSRLRRGKYVLITLSAGGSLGSEQKPRQNLGVRGFVPASELQPGIGKGRTFDNVSRKDRDNYTNAEEFDPGCKPQHLKTDTSPTDDIPLPALPSNFSAVDFPANWPPYFQQWYTYQGAGNSEAEGSGFANYSNYSGYPRPDPEENGEIDQSAKSDLRRPAALLVMASTTGIHGGGIARAVIPNPARTGRNPLTAAAAFPYLDPNGGCRPRNDPREDSIPAAVAKWYLVKGAGLVGWIPVRGANPYPTPGCP